VSLYDLATPTPPQGETALELNCSNESLDSIASKIAFVIEDDTILIKQLEQWCMDYAAEIPQFDKLNPSTICMYIWRPSFG